MARITGAADERIFQIQRWLGVNENPDGDTKLKMGEAAEMRNFRVTRDGNLQKRPGTKAVLTVESGAAIDAVWTGYVAGTERVMAVCNGHLYSLFTASTGVWEKTDIGSLGVVSSPHMFGFSGKLYILTGSNYYSWDGTTLGTVSGYVPLVAVTVAPGGANELLEQVNKLTAKRRVWLSPDGTATDFQLPEKDLASIDSAVMTSDGTTTVAFTANATTGVISFTAPPSAGTNTIEVGYTAKTDFRSEVINMRFSEFYSGTQDTRVFLYGDGSNKALYSDITYHGESSAEYFPDLNVAHVGESNTPITGMIRHYGSLAVYKSDSAYSINYGTIMLADGNETAAFYIGDINKAIGNEAPGQVQLVLNSPITLFGQDVYEWKNSNYRGSSLSRDERQARRISDRVYATLHKFDTKNCVCYDDNYNQEYYICDASGQALVCNYAADAWYLYTNFFMHRPMSVRNELYFGGTDGTVYHVSTDYTYDGNADNTVQNPIFAWWESGAMAFGQDYKRKFSAMLWVGIKPEGKASVDVTAKTDRTGSLAEKQIAQTVTGKFDFSDFDFEHLSFEVNDRPQMRRLKIKAKKFVYYKLIFKTNTADTGVTVTAADIKVRYTGVAK